MTREEAIKEFVGYQTYDIQPSVEATKMAIKALEKEIILDKARAEIKAIAINGQLDEHTMFMRAEEQIKQMAKENK